ncbi:hypothetical protein OQA88_10332 [Cercophora sp. LCS_1]
MLRSASQKYVCWRCACLRTSQKQLLQSQPGSRTLRNGYATKSRSFRGSAAGLKDSDIRRQLKEWEVNNPPDPLLQLRSVRATAGSNALALPVPESGFGDQEAYENVQLDSGDDQVDGNSLALDLAAGDLVEVTVDTWRVQLIAVCLGKFNGYDHFYTNLGQWFASEGIKTRFVVKGFVADPAELDPLVEALPSVEGSSDVLRQLKDLHAGPSREVGSPVLKRLNDFYDESRLIQQRYMSQFRQAHVLLGPKEKLMTLDEIADVLLPHTLKKTRLGFAPEELYAVHSFLCGDGVSFRPVTHSQRHNNSCLFTVASKFDVQTVETVEAVIREFLEANESTSGRTSPRSAPSATVATFRQFLRNAQKAIDQSRKSRELTRNGTIGPGIRRSAPPLSSWSKADRLFLHFIQMWAASSQFYESSLLHWIGSAVLRAVGRYGDVERFDPALGWVFLQEIGWLSPWDLHARHALRLPGVQLDRSGGLLPWPEDSHPPVLREDQLRSMRKDFKDTAVYCIDAESASDIDDGVSVEQATDGEYWVHVHVADPASRIEPKSWLAERAARLSQTIYVPGHHERMFKDDLIRDAFSLAPNKPSLVFSARVTEAGKVLEHNISPAIVRNVVYISPQNVAAVTGEELPQTPSGVFEVGTPPAAAEPPTRTMTTASDLSEQQRGELKVLAKLAQALRQVRLDKGAVPFYPPKPIVDVSFENTQVRRREEDGFIETQGDPYIRVTYGDSGYNLVSSLMQLAGQVAAKWCHQRGIPVPYRSEPLATENLEALRSFTRDVLYPQLLSGNRPSGADQRKFRHLVGKQELSAVPGPNYSMGVDMYTKATSPLRRYGDLIVHWQIEAALLEEHRRGSSLETKKRSGYAAPPTVPGQPGSEGSFNPPFSRAHLERHVFPHLRTREQHANLLGRSGAVEEYTLQALLRAWKYGQGKEQLPSTFQFEVDSVVPHAAVLRGRLDWFDAHAVVEGKDMNNVCLVQDVRLNDVFEVEISDINVHERRLSVKLLKRIENATS